MTQDNSTDQALAGATHVDAAASDAAVASLTLAELNSHLGKDFKDTATALKALKDTQSFVGKRTEDIASEVRSQLAAASSGGSSNAALESTVHSLQKDLFYTNNPQYKDYSDVIASMGSNPSEVVDSPAFKKVFAKVQVADEVEKSRSVVSSNSRLGQSKTVIEQAVGIANSRAGGTDLAEHLARGINEELSQ